MTFDANSNTNTAPANEGASVPADSSQQSASAPESNSRKSDYYSGGLQGYAYLNDIRWVKPSGKRSKPYIATRVKVMQGSKTDPNPFRVNCNIFGDKLIELLTPFVGTQEKVTAIVAISDLELSTYESKDKETGETSIVPCAYGRLFGVRKLWSKDGLVFSNTAPSEAEQPEA